MNRLADDAEVLVVELGLEARHVVALQDALAVDLEHAAGGEPAHQRLAHLGRIDAGLARDGERLAHRRQRAADADLVAGLAHLAGAGGADVHDALGVADGIEHRAHALERRRVAADHDRQRAVDGADLAAAHRRVEHRHAPGGGLLRQLPGDGRRDRAHVDDDAALPHGLEYAAGAFEHQADVWRVGHHRDDDVALRGHLSRRAGARRAGLDHRVHGRLAAAVRDDREPLLEQVEHHGLPHEPETDEANPIRHDILRDIQGLGTRR